MNLTISPYRNINLKNRPAFKADKEEDEKIYSKSDLNIAKRDGRTEGCFASIIGLVLLVFGSAYIKNKANDSQRKQDIEQFNNFMGDASSLMKSNTLNLDSFTVKDINKDDRPDIILNKKDGTTVVLDVANSQILEEKTIYSKKNK